MARVADEKLRNALGLNEGGSLFQALKPKKYVHGRGWWISLSGSQNDGIGDT